ncbi:hypothetical protein ABE036_24905 [Priestia aryabhattai]|uniref:hypothetical protein n=1 Tax=Priestia TaxID=2800373 RepID=UPI001C2F87D4|nr:hypothetical protein [Priestia megaterium]MDN3365539.1 hypothetical protein [Priestia megaterium]WKU20907.1 hypothetical protein Q3A90_00100 [Priestia megaterium]WKU20918.1 hypothetical protein Q3A90_00050 [Priestia megaterium]
MNKLLKKYLSIIVGYVIGFVVLMLLNIDVTKGAFKIFVIVSVIGLFVGELINMGLKKKTS